MKLKKIYDKCIVFRDCTPLTEKIKEQKINVSLCFLSVRLCCDAGDNSPNQGNAHPKDPFDPSLCSRLTPVRTMVSSVGTTPLLSCTEFSLLTAMLPSSPGFPSLCSEPRFSRPCIFVAPHRAVQFVSVVLVLGS